EIVGVADLRPERLAIAARRYPGIQATTDPKALITNPNIDAIVIATPVSSHFPLALDALKTGKHVFVEKPLTATSEQAMRLIDEAERRRLVLMVDHTFVYTGAVRKIREQVESGALGEIYYYDSVRVNLGLFQHDVNVLWDLAAHDLSIMDYVLPCRPCAVSATGISHVPNEPENVAYLTLFFESSIIAHIHVNWLAPVKIRRTLIGGARKMIVYDDLEPSEKIKVYDKGITISNSPEHVYEMLISYRTGDMYAPQLQMTEALQTEANHFISCIEGSASPLTGGDAGLQVVSLLEAASCSLKQRGRPVEIASSVAFV
ncbi:MAG TPA: Gfo/Idh/MocA family oxidoreductase, partial [Bryobacteraceae bacterium]|nr:Gfo/Idh/MocA family oxidoreductase [Bryobacteraceae bacterium]